MKIESVQGPISALQQVSDKSIPVMMDMGDEQMWACIDDISITTNSYGKHVVIINQIK